MAMTEKQIKKHMDKAWELHYAQYEMEAEWYGNDNPFIWVCDIPSKKITVKMELDEKTKRITIYEAEMEKQSKYNYVRETTWKVRSRYYW